jgi:hypothetical protein
MSNQNEAKYVPAGTGPVYWGPADRIMFLITGAETGGAFFLAEVSLSRRKEARHRTSTTTKMNPSI